MEAIKTNKLTSDQESTINLVVFGGAIVSNSHTIVLTKKNRQMNNIINEILKHESDIKLYCICLSIVIILIKLGY